jgi:hypothetical protein
MFIYENNKVTIDPKLLFVPQFRVIWERDRTRLKKKANRDFAFIYFMADWQSEYNAYGLDKEVYIAEDIMRDKKYRADEEILAAIQKYEELQETSSMSYLKSVRKTVYSLIKYYDDLRYKGKEGDLELFDPAAITKSMKEIGGIVDNLEKYEKKVKSEEEIMQIRGGGNVGVFEDKEKATWLIAREK